MLLGVVQICRYDTFIFTTPVCWSTRKLRVIMHTEYLQQVKYYGTAYGQFRISNIFVSVTDLFAVVCNTFCIYVSQHDDAGSVFPGNVTLK